MSINDRLSQVSNGACGIDRRGFLARCAGCSLVSGCMVGAWAGPVLGKPTAMEGRPRVRLVFSHIPPGQPTWPYINYDYEAQKRELTRRLVQGCPEIEFLPATVHTADAARRLIAEDWDRPITGYLVAMVGIWTGAPRRSPRLGNPPCLWMTSIRDPASSSSLTQPRSARGRTWPGSLRPGSKTY